MYFHYKSHVEHSSQGRLQTYCAKISITSARSKHLRGAPRMSSFSKTLLFALALVALLSSDVVIKVTADGGGSLAPEDCRQMPVAPGPCDRTACMHYCQANIGPGAVGECVSGGCQCSYCTAHLRN
uniref:Uncharacterized protein n=1 Tax=Avena sativa TaxID=4498 RepID=A0ACD5X4F2_AVESA